MLWDIQYCLLGAGLGASRPAIAEFTFKGVWDIWVDKDGPEGTGDHAGLAGDARTIDDFNYTILDDYGIRGTVLPALGFPALFA